MVSLPTREAGDGLAGRRAGLGVRQHGRARGETRAAGWSGTRSSRASWVGITDAVAWFVSRVLTLLEDTTKVDLSKDWFSGTGGPYRTVVLGITAVLLVGFLFVGIVRGSWRVIPRGWSPYWCATCRWRCSGW